MPLRLGEGRTQRPRKRPKEPDHQGLRRHNPEGGIMETMPNAAQLPRLLAGRIASSSPTRTSCGQSHADMARSPDSRRSRAAYVPCHKTLDRMAIDATEGQDVQFLDLSAQTRLATRL